MHEYYIEWIKFVSFNSSTTVSFQGLNYLHSVIKYFLKILITLISLVTFSPYSRIKP